MQEHGTYKRMQIFSHGFYIVYCCCRFTVYKMTTGLKKPHCL